MNLVTLSYQEVGYSIRIYTFWNSISFVNLFNFFIIFQLLQILRLLLLLFACFRAKASTEQLKKPFVIIYRFFITYFDILRWSSTLLRYLLHLHTPIDSPPIHSWHPLNDLFILLPVHLIYIIILRLSVMLTLSLLLHHGLSPYLFLNLFLFLNESLIPLRSL